MSLVGLVFMVCALIVLFDMVVALLQNYKVVDVSKNEGLKKAVDVVGKITKPVYDKVAEVIPEKYRVVSGINLIPLLVFIVLSVLGQMLL